MQTAQAGHGRNAVHDVINKKTSDETMQQSCKARPKHGAEPASSGGKEALAQDATHAET